MYTHILIPIALDHEHKPDDALAVAKALLKPGGKITAIHAMEPIPAYVSQYLPEQAAENRAAAMVAALHEELGDEDVTCVAVQGHAGSAIVDYAGHHDVDLIIVASHRPGLQDYFLGSTAARVVRHAQCPVHVLR